MAVTLFLEMDLAKVLTAPKGNRLAVAVITFG